MRALITSDLPVSDGEVPTESFCEYLYEQITGWRTSKDPQE
jgi:hypothetical protein